MEEELKEGLDILGIKITEKILNQFDCYCTELLEWNKKINLISRKDEKNLIKKHILDSLNSIKFIEKGVSVLDIGTGAGLPGIPIKIVRNDVNMELLEIRLKKVHFLKEVVKKLGIQVKIVRERAENVNGKYDIVISRAVGRVKWLTEIGENLVKKEGKIITYKGEKLEEELKDTSNWKVVEETNRKFSKGKIIVLVRE
jgi:16S rRNA (guanine527-N7)-methyltransferase